MAKCDYCQHVEMCCWRKSIDEIDCDFFDDGNKWIPVNERLPEEGIEVLVWYRYWRYGEYNNWYYTYGIGYQFDDYWSVIDGGTKTTVYAWQELPEPYEPQESEEQPAAGGGI